MLRSCYSCDFRLDAAGTLRRVQWSFCRPDAKPFPGQHRYGSTIWSPDPTYDDGQVGEFGTRTYYKGYPALALAGQSPDGPLAYWRDGVPAVWSPIAADPAGLPIGCGRDACSCTLNVRGFRIEQFSTNPYWSTLNLKMPLLLTKVERFANVAVYRTDPLTFDGGARLECGRSPGPNYLSLDIFYRAAGDPTNRSLNWIYFSNPFQCQPSNNFPGGAWTPSGPIPPDFPSTITIHRIN